MSERREDSLLFGLQDLKRIQEEREAEQRASEVAKREAARASREAEERRKLEALEAQQRAEEERQRLERERRESIEREERIKQEAAARQAAIVAEEQRRRDLVAAEAAAAAKAHTARLRKLVLVSVVVSMAVLGGIGYLVYGFYKTKQHAKAVVAQNEKRAKQLESQIERLNEDIAEDMRRNADSIRALKGDLSAAPAQARAVLEEQLKQAEQRKQLMEAQRERAERRFERRKRRKREVVQDL